MGLSVGLRFQRGADNGLHGIEIRMTYVRIPAPPTLCGALQGLTLKQHPRSSQSCGEEKARHWLRPEAWV